MEVLANKPAVLGATLAAGLAGGLAEAPAADAALNGFGPKMSHNLNKANDQLDQRLEMEGPNGCVARAIAATAHIDTEAGRRKYITPSNVDFSSKTTVTNEQFPVNTGATENCTPTRIPNNHESSVAFRVALKNAPQKTKVHAVLNKEGKWVVSDRVNRADCGLNSLQGGKQPHKRKMHEKRFKVNVGPGIAAKLESVSNSTSESNSNSEITCPDGTTVSVKNFAVSNAEAIAKAKVRLMNGKEKVFITGRNMGYGKFKTIFDKKLRVYLSTFAESHTNTSTSTQIKCGVPTPPPTTEVKPKDGTVGPGAGTPGNTNTGSTVGGTGAGGQPGNLVASVPCYDSNRLNVGDGKTTTEGEIMYVWNKDQVDINQECMVIAEPAVNP